MDLIHQLTPMLKSLRLSGILETLELRNRGAIDSKLSYVEFLAQLVEDEVERRAQHKLKMRLRRAAFDPQKTLETFDFSACPKVSQKEIADLATCRFVEAHQNVFFVGPSGVGKSHLAQALGHEACRRGYEVVFMTAARALAHLAAGRADGTYERRLEFSPMNSRRLSVYEPERTELAVGDRVRITRNDPTLDLANGDRFSVAAVSRGSVTLADGKRRVELPADRPLHVDHAYATTVHASQGTTAERVLIDATTRSRTTSQEVYYVAISRARQGARIYTDDLARLPAAIAREHTKHAALDLDRSGRDR